MATRKNIRIGERLGCDPEQVQLVLNRVNPSTRAQWIYCSEQLGCDVNQLQLEAAKPAPEPLPMVLSWEGHLRARAIEQRWEVTGPDILPRPSRPDGT